jgi:DTW domain-containing protein YfiP
MKIFLLTHERELHRATNTGSLAIGSTNEIVERIVWARVSPDKNLTQLILENFPHALSYLGLINAAAIFNCRLKRIVINRR